MRIERILLIFPPMVFSRRQSRQTAIFPLGLGYLAAVLRPDYEVRLLDNTLEGYDQIRDLDEGRSVYGLTDEQLRAAIRDFAPQVVGVSCLFSTLHGQTLLVARCAKEVSREIITVAGGPHPSAVPEQLLADENLDYCVLGEGERTMVALMRRLAVGAETTDLEGIAFRDADRGEVVVNPRRALIEELDSLPFPARDLVDQERYFSIGRVQGLRLDGERQAPLRLMQLTTSRGCPNRCTFCGVGATWGRSYRTRTPTNILDEIEALIERHGMERLCFQDDNLTAHRKHAEQLFDGMVERGFGITWEGYNGVQASTLNERLLEKMRASGCMSIRLGVESGSPQILKRIKKPVNLKALPGIVARARELGIDVRGLFMIGFPGETREQVLKTFEVARSLDFTEAAFAIVTPLPGTALFQECVDQGLLDEARLDYETLSFGGMNLQLSEVSVAELKRLRKIEWLRTVFADPDGNLKADLPISRQELMIELENGLALYPDSEEISTLYQQALVRFADVSPNA